MVMHKRKLSYPFTVTSHSGNRAVRSPRSAYLNAVKTHDGRRFMQITIPGLNNTKEVIWLNISVVYEMLKWLALDGNIRACKKSEKLLLWKSPEVRKKEMKQHHKGWKQ